MSNRNIISGSASVPEHWQKKLMTYFKLVDFGRDGTLSKEDHLQFLYKMKQHYSDSGREMTEAQWCSIANTFVDVFWNIFMARELDSDELDYKLTPQMFIANMTKYLKGENKYCLKMELLKQSTLLFDVIDYEKNNTMSLKEYKMFLKLLGADTSFVHIAFDSIDTHNTGSISKDEFRDAYIDFWMNTEKGCGSYLLGRLEEPPINPKELVLWEKKMSTYFDILDILHDGKLGKDDLTSLLYILEEHYRIGGKLMTEKQWYALARSFIDEFWNNILMRGRCRKGSDYKIDKHEFVIEMSSHLSGENLEQLRREAKRQASLIFDIVDIDGNNVLSLKEYRRFLKLLGADDSHYTDAFNLIDTSKNGKLSRLEFQEAYADFWVGIKEGCGTYLFGELHY